MDELSEEDKTLVWRAKKIQKFLTQPMFMAEFASGIKGCYIPMKKTVDDFERILKGEYDKVPEAAFYLAGTLEDVEKKAKQLKQTHTNDSKNN